MSGIADAERSCANEDRRGLAKMKQGTRRNRKPAISRRRRMTIPLDAIRRLFTRERLALLRLAESEMDGIDAMALRTRADEYPIIWKMLRELAPRKRPRE